MMSKIKQFITIINKNCDALEFGDARRMMELNLEELQQPANYVLLNANATVLLKYILNQKQSTEEPLTRLEMFQISEINKYCTNFDISMLKRTIKNCLHLLQRSDIENYLNANAKTVLSSMGAFIEREMEHA